MKIRFLLVSALVMAGASTFALAAGSGGHFRYDKVRMDVRHAYAVPKEGAEGSVLVFLTSLPIEPQAVANAFDPGSEVEDQIRGKSGGYVRVCIAADGSECGLYFSHNEPMESFNLSGSGTFKLTSQGPKRVEGSWKIDETKFFEKTYDFDLRFAVAVTQPTPGKALPADGGEPGRAYQAYITALAKGDLPALRKILGESAAWQLPEGDESSAKESLKWMRDGKPVSAKILSAMQRGDSAILTVEGVDRDDIKRRGRVLMVRDGDTWRHERSDLSSVD